jgi:hypothetical protein
MVQILKQGKFFILFTKKYMIVKYTKKLLDLAFAFLVWMLLVLFANLSGFYINKMNDLLPLPNDL